MAVPPLGAMLIYSEGMIDEAVQFNRPARERTIPVSGRVIYVQNIQGAVGWLLKWQGNEPFK
jgi:hypothetical protein